MTQKIVFHNDPTQLNIWSHVKERLYSPFDLIVRENITQQDRQAISHGTIKQVTQILPASILNQNAKIILGAHNDFDFDVLKKEIEENAMLGFHTSPEHLALHPDLRCENQDVFFQPYYEAYHQWGNVVCESFAIDATVCAEDSDDYLKVETAHVERKDHTSVMVMPFITMVKSKHQSMTSFDDSFEQDNILDHIQKSHFVDFNHYDAVPNFGWFDCVRARHFIQHHQCQGLILTFPDFLPTKQPIQLCSAYLIGNDVIQSPTSDMRLEDMLPFYETYEGWDMDLSKISQLYDFPASFFKLIKRIEQLVNCPVLSIVTASHSVKDSKINLSFPTLF